MNCLADLAQANLRALHNRGDILDPKRCSIRSLENGSLDILHVAIEADFTDVDLLLPLLDEAATGIGVVVGELLLHLANAQTIGDELVRIDPHLIFASDATETRDIHHPGTDLNCFSNDQSWIDLSSMLS